MGTLGVIERAKGIEGALLGRHRGLRRAQRGGSESAMHAFVRPIVLGLPRATALVFAQARRAFRLDARHPLYPVFRLIRYRPHNTVIV